MLKIGSGYQLPAGTDLSVLDRLPVHVHKYGDPQPDNQVFRWMQYASSTPDEGYIAFARNLGNFMPEVARSVADFLESKMDIQIDVHRVNFMKTVGYVGPHRDEVRTSVINIGIQNTDAAFTRESLDNDYDTFETEYEDTMVEIGSAYVVNVQNVHAVIPRSMKERLLITCGFGVTYDQLLTRLKR